MLILRRRRLPRQVPAAKYLPRLGNHRANQNRNASGGGVLLSMKGLIVFIAAFIFVFGTVASRAANLDRISAETGVSIATLQAERASTGLGWGGLEKAHLLPNASGQSFDTIVGKFQGHEGWGQIAHDYGLNLGKVVSGAHRSSQATLHAKNTQTVHGKSSSMHGKSATSMGRGHSSKMTTTRGVAHRSSFKSGFSGSHGTHSMGHMSGSHGMGGMGHGGRGR